MTDEKKQYPYYLICDDCKKRKKDVKATICPYQHEIHDKHVDCTLCDDCYYERGLEI